MRRKLLRLCTLNAGLFVVFHSTGLIDDNFGAGFPGFWWRVNSGLKATFHLIAVYTHIVLFETWQALERTLTLVGPPARNLCGHWKCCPPWVSALRATLVVFTMVSFTPG